MSAVVRLIPKPPALVVSKKMNFSLPGLLYSSMASIRSSWAVPPSIRQYSNGRSIRGWGENTTHGELTETAEETVILHYIKDSTHLTEYQHTRPIRFHLLKKLVENDHLSSIVDDVFVRSVGGSWFLLWSLALISKRWFQCLLTAPSNR